MGLSLAVVLGFNIGGGNIRDRLAQGEKFMQCSIKCAHPSVI